MDVLVHPGKLSGELLLPPSKSDLHRALICAAFADAPVTLSLPGSTILSEDISATVGCLEALGANIIIHYEEFSDVYGEVTSIFVDPVKKAPSEATLHCCESASTLRFLLPLAACVCPCVHFTGQGRLPDRPLTPLIEEMKAHGFHFSSDTLPFTVTHSDSREFYVGRGGRRMAYTLPGNISSQYISALLFAGAVLGGIDIRLTTQLESAPYVAMTLQTLRAFGVRAARDNEGYIIPRPSSLHSPGTYPVEGDWSSAAFFIAADILAGNKPVLAAPPVIASGNDLPDDCITLSGLRLTSPHADAIAPALIGRLAEGRPGNDPSGILRADDSGRMYLDARQIPDLVPILAVTAFVEGRQLTVTGAHRLRLKESDRILSSVSMLRALGARAYATEDGLAVESGRTAVNAGQYHTVDGASDHRIVMAAAIGALYSDVPVLIRGADAASKSYPDFWNDFASLGGQFDIM